MRNLRTWLIVAVFEYIELSTADIAAIDAAGLLGPKGLRLRKILKRVAVTAALSVVGFAVASYLGIDVL